MGDVVDFCAYRNQARQPMEAAPALLMIAVQLSFLDLAPAQGQAPRAAQTGNRYDATKDQERAEIAQHIRADIRAATRQGRLPAGLKVSVRSGRARDVIYLTITAVPPTFNVWNPAYLEWVQGHPQGDPPFEVWKYFTREYHLLCECLTAIADAYNPPDGPRRFYPSVGLDETSRRDSQEQGRR
ncbi:hypothetical protein [Nitrospirillum amazonense]|uniref:hypothetical protein n=1 Tax=Nitrospirillum amazonense TaxID=28077 RepID=UPI002412733D|nr:hypothetical protein [Nitrospirillum amazonense]MDG3443708.1 hypothetical protein [Nitrospirillum amazonense]